jgi:hypothetical protein
MTAAAPKAHSHEPICQDTCHGRLDHIGNAGDADGKASEFLGVIDAAPASPRYGSIVASISTGTAGTHSHHTELEMPANGHLLANGFHAGCTWLPDLTRPERKSLILNGEMSEWLKEHAWKLIPATRADAQRDAPTRSPSTTSRNNDMHRGIPVTEGI